MKMKKSLIFLCSVLLFLTARANNGGDVTDSLNGTPGTGTCSNEL